MRHVLFRRILISYLIIAPVLFISLELYLSRIIKNNYITKLSNSLLIQSSLIAEKIPLSVKGNLDSFCKIYKGKTGARVTIIDSTGKVLGDSDESSERMENHIDRPEIQEASINNTGSAIRFSRTIQKDFFYFAVALDGKAGKGFFRLSVPLHDMEREISDVRTRAAIASLTALLIAILMGIFQTRKVTKSIEEITNFSRDVRSGNFRARLFLKEKGEMGELAHNISGMADELRLRLEQSQADKQKTEEILKNMSDGLMLIDAEGKVIICNPAARKFFNLKNSIEGSHITDNIRKAELIDIINKAVKDESPVSGEIEIQHPGELHLMATAVPFQYAPEGRRISGIVISLHDITRLKKLEEIRKDFVANVSHEIKTPITAIKGFAETLIDGAIDDRENALRFLQTIKNHSERLNSLVSDLLTLSGIELGEITIEKRDSDLDSISDMVFTTLKGKAHAKGLYLRKSFPEGITMISADKDRLMQILLNLVDNGIKFAEQGGITVGLEKEGNNVVLFVEDTGIGIAKHHLSRLGERFYRVDRSRSRELGGTGLGLAIVKHLVKAHGWDMQIESAPGKGTKVKIILS